MYYLKTTRGVLSDESYRRRSLSKSMDRMSIGPKSSVIHVSDKADKAGERFAKLKRSLESFHQMMKHISSAWLKLWPRRGGRNGIRL